MSGAGGRRKDDNGVRSSSEGDDGGTCHTNQDTYFMRRALQVAKEALAIGEVPVGCVIVLRDGSLIEPSISSSPNHSNLRHDVVIGIGACSYDYDQSPSVIISHGANQVNATRDATRHAEMVAVDRMLTQSRSSDQMKLSPDVICKSAKNDVPQSKMMKEDDDDKWINMPQSSCRDHWKDSFGWGSGRLYDKDVFSHCDLYVTCEPCIMCAAALSMIGINKVFFGCKNDRFGGCGSLLNLHRSDELPSSKHHGFEITGGICEEEAVTLLRSFYDRENFHAPDDKRKRKPATKEGSES